MLECEEHPKRQSPCFQPHHEDLCGSEGKAPHIPNSGTSRGWMVNFTLHPHYPWGKSHYLFKWTFSAIVLVYTRPVKLVYSFHSPVGGYNIPEECTTTIFTPLPRRWCLYISLKPLGTSQPRSVKHGCFNVTITQCYIFWHLRGSCFKGQSHTRACLQMSTDLSSSMSVITHTHIQAFLMDNTKLQYI
jgi:hypothetical protein